MTNLDDLEDLLRRGEKEKAYELVKEDKGITAGILINEGISSGVLGEYSISISYFELAERIADDDETKEEARKNMAISYNNRGNAYAELKQYENAIEDFNKAIEVNPKFAEAYNNRGPAYAELKQYGRAIEDYNRAIELNPKFAKAYNNRGIAYAKLKQHERVIEDFNKAIDINPKFAEAYNNRGLAYAELEQYGRAIEDFNKAIDINPEDAKAYYNRGADYYTLKQYENAIEDYNKAIDINPEFVEAYANRGLTRLRANEDIDRAIEDFKQARSFFEEKDRERMLGFIEWSNARKEMNRKNWTGFRERISEAREIFGRINDHLSRSIGALINFSYLDEKLDNALRIADPVEASDEIENALNNVPCVFG